MKGDVVLVTGSSEGGIGYALCKAFAAKQCRVFASARRLEAMAGLLGTKKNHSHWYRTVCLAREKWYTHLFTFVYCRKNSQSAPVIM